MTDNKEISEFELKNKKTIEKFGQDKCLEAYEMASKHIPLKPNQKYATWQEMVSAELSVSEDEAMDLWAAGNSIVQEKYDAQSKGIISKIGEEKCKEIYKEISEVVRSDPDWQKTISEKYNVEQSDVFDIFTAGASIMMKESAPGMYQAIKKSHENKPNLPSCPKKCGGKLHKTVSLHEEANGLYICDQCSSTFRKK